MENYIALIGIIITATLSVVALNRNSWNQTVSQSRNHWLNEFREEFSIIIGTMYYILTVNCNQDNMNDKIYKAEIARAKLFTRINTNKLEGNEYNASLKSILNEIQFDSNYISKKNIYALQEMVNRILEVEWEKVKKESRGAF